MSPRQLADYLKLLRPPPAPIVFCTKGRFVFSVLAKVGFGDLHELTNVLFSLLVGLVDDPLAWLGDLVLA
jgi:hypothetical protein